MLGRGLQRAAGGTVRLDDDPIEHLRCPQPVYRLRRQAREFPRIGAQPGGSREVPVAR